VKSFREKRLPLIMGIGCVATSLGRYCRLMHAAIKCNSLFVDFSSSFGDISCMLTEFGPMPARTPQFAIMLNIHIEVPIILIAVSHSSSASFPLSESCLNHFSPIASLLFSSHS